ncbi:hypothetical protein HDU76_006400, partial [Blyttiomyces sp. JEL0837]
MPPNGSPTITNVQPPRRRSGRKDSIASDGSDASSMDIELALDVLQALLHAQPDYQQQQQQQQQQQHGSVVPKQLRHKASYSQIMPAPTLMQYTPSPAPVRKASIPILKFTSTLPPPPPGSPITPTQSSSSSAGVFLPPPPRRSASIRNLQEAYQSQQQQPVPAVPALPPSILKKSSSSMALNNLDPMPMSPVDSMRSISLDNRMIANYLSRSDSMENVSTFMQSSVSSANSGIQTSTGPMSPMSPTFGPASPRSFNSSKIQRDYMFPTIPAIKLPPAYNGSSPAPAPSSSPSTNNNDIMNTIPSLTNLHASNAASPILLWGTLEKFTTKSSSPKWYPYLTVLTSTSMHLFPISTALDEPAIVSLPRFGTGTQLSVGNDKSSTISIADEGLRLEWDLRVPAISTTAGGPPSPPISSVNNMSDSTTTSPASSPTKIKGPSPPPPLSPVPTATTPTRVSWKPQSMAEMTMAKWFPGRHVWVSSNGVGVTRDVEVARWVETLRMVVDENKAGSRSQQVQQPPPYQRVRSLSTIGTVNVRRVSVVGSGGVSSGTGIGVVVEEEEPLEFEVKSKVATVGDAGVGVGTSAFGNGRRGSH